MKSQVSVCQVQRLFTFCYYAFTYFLKFFLGTNTSLHTINFMKKKLFSQIYFSMSWVKVKVSSLDVIEIFFGKNKNT